MKYERTRMVAFFLLVHNENPLLLALIFFCAGMLGTARLYLDQHSPAQIFMGFLTGFASQFILLFLLH